MSAEKIRDPEARWFAERADGPGPYETQPPRVRVEREILDAFENDYEPDAREVAEALVDEDVAAGDYEGCSSELELAFMEYEQIAKEVLG